MSLRRNISERFDNGSASVLHLRLIELFSFFAIVVVARTLGGFNYDANGLFVIFVSAVFLQYNAEWLWQQVARARGWGNRETQRAIHWYSSYVDMAAVLGIVYLTGTIESPFMLLLTVPLFFASHTFSWRTTLQAFFAVSLAMLASLAMLEYSGVLPHQNCYWFEADAYTNGHFVAGSLLVVAAFVGLVLFLSHAFQDRWQSSLDELREKDRKSSDKINQLERLYDISIGVNSAISMETLLKLVAKEATLLLKQPWAGIVLFNSKQEITESVFVGVNQGDAMRVGKRIHRGGLCEWIWTHNAPIIVSDAKKDRRAHAGDFRADAGIRAVIGFPLTAAKQVQGVLLAGDFEPKQFTDQHIRLLTNLATQLSMAMEKSSLYDTMEKTVRSLSVQLETQEKANILKSDFVNHVSHELRTPLTSIKAYVETLIENIDSPAFVQRTEFLDIVGKETNRLIRIVNDILDVSKIEFGQRPLERTSVRLVDLLEDVTSMLTPSIREKDIVITQQIPADLPKLDGDADLLKQVLINLLSNAVKYSHPGGQVRVTAVENPVDIAISVEDEGIGIPAQELGNVFDKYFRVRSTNKKFEGVGLGLAIVKNVVEQHGGQIGVESEEGKGSKFTFSIPREHCFNDLIGYIAEVVDAKDKLHEMLELIVSMIAELLASKTVSLMLLDKTRAELFIKVSYGLDEWVVENTRVKVGEGIAGKVAQEGVPLFISNIEQNDVFSAPNNPQYDTQSLISVPLIVNDIVVGVINVNNKASGNPYTEDDLTLLLSFSQRISKALERVRVVEDSHSFLEDTIEAFRRMLENQSRSKVVEHNISLAVRVARKLGFSEKDTQVIQYVASVHDIGMTEVSDNILNKALHLTEDELRVIREHPQRGAELIRPLEFVESVSNIILYHHERMDGKGYPMGLKGDEIPIGARVLAVIDAYSAMTREQAYRERRSPLQAVQELVECAGTQFDHRVVEALVSVLAEDSTIDSVSAEAYQRQIEEMVATKA